MLFLLLFFSLTSSSSPSVRFHSVFFLKSCVVGSVLSESLGINFAILCIAPRKGFISSLDFVLSGCKMALFYSPFSFNPCSFISCPSQVVSLTKTSDFFWLARYRLSLDFSIIVNSFFRCFYLSPLLRLIYRQATSVSGNLMYGLFSLEILLVRHIGRKIFF